MKNLKTLDELSEKLKPRSETPYVFDVITYFNTLKSEGTPVDEAEKKVAKEYKIDQKTVNAILHLSVKDLVYMMSRN